MSRSYRKNPYVTELQSASDNKQRKRRANRKVRKADVADGGAFKKASSSWDISDYSFYSPEHQKASRK